MDGKSYARSSNAIWAWWREHSIATVDHAAVLRRIADESGWSARYIFLVLISAGIAILGLLLPSSAVLIGAMLISPLMSPIIGLGFALASFDFDEMRRAGIALALGAIFAILFTALFVAISPVQTVTNEIAVRTHPNLFDLLVALLSALAGAYALIRGHGETVVGVAIAIALMPPLAVVGFGVATWNLTIAGGALLLFMTNFITIALTAAFMARLYGFGSHLTPAHTRLQSLLMVVGMAALAIPLGLTLRQIAWETLAARQIRDAIQAEFPADARISDLETDFRAHPIKIVGTVLTSRYEPQAAERIEARLGASLRRQISADIDQLRVGTGNEEATQLLAAQTRDRAQAVDRLAERAADRLALVAGVGTEAVIVDRANRRATVMAQPVAGASLDLYRRLEQRAGADLDGWTLTVTPPPLALPAISFDGDAPDSAGQASLDLIAWAAQRQTLGLVLRGEAAATQAASFALAARGVDPARLSVEPARGEAVTVGWRLP